MPPPYAAYNHDCKGNNCMLCKLGNSVPYGTTHYVNHLPGSSGATLESRRHGSKSTNRLAGGELNRHRADADQRRLDEGFANLRARAENRNRQLNQQRNIAGTSIDLTQEEAQVPTPSQPSTATPVQSADVSNSGTVVDMAVEPQAGGGVPGGTGSSQVPSVVTAEHLPDIEYKFCKTFQVYTAGFTFKKFGTSFFRPPNVDFSGVLRDGAAAALATPMAVLDPNALEIYMTPYEWSQLPLLAYATRAEIKVTPQGFRLPFATNEAASTYANSQTLVQLISSVGLNNIMNGMVCQYTVDPAKTTEVAGNHAPSVNDFADDLYGLEGSIGANTGVPRHLNRYFAVLFDDRMTDVRAGTPNLMQHVNIQNVNDVKGTPVINYEHNFKCGVLKTPSRSQTSILNAESVIFEGNNPAGLWTRLPNAPESATNRNISMYGETNPNSSNANPGMNYYTMIEKAQFMSRQWGHRMTPDYAPLPMFGVMPVQSNAPLAASATFTDVAVIWQIETCLYVKSQLNTIHPNLDVFYLKSWDPQLLIKDFRTQTFNGSFIYALISNRRVPHTNAWDPQQLPVQIIQSAGNPRANLPKID